MGRAGEDWLPSPWQMRFTTQNLITPRRFRPSRMFWYPTLTSSSLCASWEFVELKVLR